MYYMREKSLPDHLSSQIDYNRRNLVTAIFSLAGGDAREAQRLAASNQMRINESLKELCQRSQRPGPIAAREREIAVKQFPLGFDEKKP